MSSLMWAATVSREREEPLQMRRKPAHRKNTVARARLLENAISALRMLGFEVFRGQPEFKRAGLLVPRRYIIRNCPHLSLYGTIGFKEALIHDDGHEFVFEAKLQNVGGSVDEKLPYLFECFLVSSVPDWIVWFDGNFWTKNPRALKAIEWLRIQVVSDRMPKGRHFHICGTEDEWHALALHLFKQERAAA